MEMASCNTVEALRVIAILKTFKFLSRLLQDMSSYEIINIYIYMHGFWIPSVLLAKLSSCRASKNALSYSTDFINFILIQIYVLFNVSKRSWCHLHSHITPRTRAGESLCTGGRRLDEVYHCSTEMVEVDSSRCQGLLSLRGPDLVWRKSALQNRSHRCCTRVAVSSGNPRHFHLSI